MRVVLINVPYLHIYGPDRKAVNSHFSLGLGYIAAVLKKNGYEVAILDPEAEGLNPEGLKKRIKQENPSLVGITATTATYVSACKIAQIVREVSDSLIVLGGPHATIMPEMVLTETKDFDLLVIGEGEHTMLELCKRYEQDGKGMDLSSIEGIIYRDSHGLSHRTPPRPLINNLDELPFPARELVNMEYYFSPNAFNSRGEKSATMFTSRGCPFNCVFCASHLIHGKQYRFHSPEYVVAEMEHLVKEYGIKHILLKDDTFTVNRKRVEDICQLIIKKGLKLDISCLSRVDMVSYELLELMKRAGFYCICFGIETGDEEILKGLKKGTTISQARDALRWCNKLGYKTHCTFMFGNPGDTKETVQKTISLARELNPTLALFYILVPYPGTQLYETYVSSVFKEHPRWEEFVISLGTALINHENLSKLELKNALRQAYCQYYLRPKAIWNIVKQIKTLKEFDAYLKGGFGLLKRMLTLKGRK